MSPRDSSESGSYARFLSNSCQIQDGRRSSWSDRQHCDRICHIWRLFGQSDYSIRSLLPWGDNIVIFDSLLWAIMWIYVGRLGLSTPLIDATVRWSTWNTVMKKFFFRIIWSSWQTVRLLHRHILRVNPLKRLMTLENTRTCRKRHVIKKFGIAYIYSKHLLHSFGDLSTYQTPALN